MERRPCPLGALVKHIDLAMRKRAESAVQADDLTFAQLHALAALEHRPDGAATLKELERQFRVAQSTMAGIAARLEKKNLIESVPDESDRRVKRVRITPEGRALCCRAKTAAEASEQELLSVLTQREQEQLFDLLLKINDSLAEKEGVCCP